MRKANTYLTVALLAGMLGHFGFMEIKVLAVVFIGVAWCITFFVILFENE